jgi:hypothetical protein
MGIGNMILLDVGIARHLRLFLSGKKERPLEQLFYIGLRGFNGFDR